MAKHHLPSPHAVVPHGENTVKKNALQVCPHSGAAIQSNGKQAGIKQEPEHAANLLVQEETNKRIP